MTPSKSLKSPGPDHPIAIAGNPARVVVTVGGRVLADSRRSLTLTEADYGPVRYLPREDVDMSRLTRSPHVTWCPYKGECAYFHIHDAGERGVNAVWTYETPQPAVAEIRDHLAFYPSRVDSIDERSI